MEEEEKEEGKEKEEDVPTAGTDNHHLPDLILIPSHPQHTPHSPDSVPQPASSSTLTRANLPLHVPLQPSKALVFSPPIRFLPGASVPSSCSFCQSSRGNKVNGKEGVTANKRTPTRRLYMLQ
ncbi:hypothetical protein E2C01_029963 [Portunus trituberculatus]|uniref:Uncharacterized protein n=1 Tax=Portunus trituberculatus TaxID=210409 RepID=A0A5B7EUD9_PORTR|nr:hypothetical protein [Portunus trituberculatus]